MARKSRKHIAEPIFTSVSPFINTALYIRLSVEDNKKRGNSIETQKMVLKDYLSNKPEFRIYDTYIDNGTTGTNFNREGFQRMLSDIEAGKIDCVIVKDLSRLGRNSIDSGYYIEQYFPSHNVRFIAVTDQFDSENPDNLHGGIILPLKNMINEAYSLDIGRKIKAQARQDIYCIKRQLEVSLEKKNVKSRIAAYDEYYKRMCPGYQRGEILMRREKLFNLGILSYKTNTPKSMRFNVLGLMNYMNTELLIGMSCDLENAFDALPKFTAMLQSIEVNE